MVGCVELVDRWCVWIPNNEPKLQTASKVVWRISFWISMLKVEGGVIDIVAVREEKYAPTDVSTGYPPSFSTILEILYQG